MVYELVLITNLGVITPLQTFDNRTECLIERTAVEATDQSSAQCLPAASHTKFLEKIVLTNDIQHHIEHIRQIIDCKK
jgi:hypothetical protein